MPYYKFRNKETGEEMDELMSHSSLEGFVKDHPELERVFEFPHINTINSATYIEGHIPNSRKQAFDIEKKIAGMKAEEYNIKPEDRGEVQKEIKELESKRKAPIGTNKGHNQND
jgi:hypothetical protein